MDRDEAIQKARTEAEEMYRTGQFLCSEAILLVANEYLGKPVSEEKHLLPGVDPQVPDGLTRAHPALHHHHR